VTSASDLPLRTIKFCFVLFSIVVHAGCDKQDPLMRGDLYGKWTSTLTAINYCTVDRRNCCSHSNSHRSDRLIGRESRFCLPALFDALIRGRGHHRYIAMTFGTEIIEWSLHGGEKNWRHVYSFRQNTGTWRRPNVRTDRQTDRRTDWRTPCDDIGRTIMHSTAQQNATYVSPKTEFLRD